MLYQAIYTLSNKIKKEILRTVQCDSYYPMYDPHFGTGLWIRESEGISWGDYLFLPTGVRYADPSDIGWEEIEKAIEQKNLKKVRWLTCNYNYASVRIFNNWLCLFTVEGARHGIPMYLAPAFKGIEPLKILHYETHCPHWWWWETLDDHPEDREWLEEKFGRST